jgi:dihydrofolate synthase/folylpolyglutamate synthase
VDIAVIETGLGGRLDSTNIITPEISVITNISPDHMNLLGETIEKIAGEKAGIIKSNIPVVVGERQADCDFVFLQKAQQEKAPISFASDSIRANRIEHNFDEQTLSVSGVEPELQTIKLDLPGGYQNKNLATVLQTILELRKRGWKIENEPALRALENVRTLTGLQGRWQKLKDSPLVICDVGHNKAGIETILEQLKEYSFDHLRMVIGMVNDKDISTILKMLPKSATYYYCKANIPRALDAEELMKKANAFGLKGNTYSSVKAALEAAIDDTKANDLIFVGGSTFVVAEVI